MFWQNGWKTQVSSDIYGSNRRLYMQAHGRNMFVIMVVWELGFWRGVIVLLLRVLGWSLGLGFFGEDFSWVDGVWSQRTGVEPPGFWELGSPQYHQHRRIILGKNFAPCLLALGGETDDQGVRYEMHVSAAGSGSSHSNSLRRPRPHRDMHFSDGRLK